MDSEDPLTPLEQNLGARLAQHPQGPHLNAADLVSLAVLGKQSPNYASSTTHIVTCPSCRAMLRRFQAMENAGKRAKAGQANLRRRYLTVGATAFAVLAAVFILLPKRTIVTLQDNGGQIRLTAANDLSGLPNLTPTQKDEITTLLQSGKVPTSPVLTDLRSSTGSSPATMAFPVTAPRATVVTASQPEFTWKMPPNAVACRVFLTSVTNPSQSIQSKPLKADHWKPKKPLVPGQIYTWQVVALDKSGKEMAREPAQANVAKFKVLEKDRTALLDQERTKLGNSHLAMGTLYAQEGLLDDAEREFQALRQTNPDSPLAQRLYASVHALRG